MRDLGIRVSFNQEWDFFVAQEGEGIREGFGLFGASKNGSRGSGFFNQEPFAIVGLVGMVWKEF